MRHPVRLLRLPLALPALMRYLLGRADRGELKSALVQAALGGSTRSAVDAWTSQFASHLLRRGVHADALEAIARHRRGGDVLALLSASVDLYVPAVGRSLGFTEILCTEVRWNGDRLAGTLVSGNRRGAAKVFSLAELRARHPGIPVTAYGNSLSDLEHLKITDHPVLVNGSSRARHAAARAGIPCQSWD